MQRMGLSQEDYALWLAAIKVTHQRRIILRIMDLSGRPLGDLEPTILSGAVTGDAKAAPTRYLEVEFLDVAQALTFGAESAGDAPIHRSRMVQVIDARFVPALGVWVECAVFTGPITDYTRTGAVVSLNAEGKEVQALGARWDDRSWRAKTSTHQIIRALLYDTGERFLRIPKSSDTVPRRFTVMQMDKPWLKARKLARSINRQLFYDGRGVATMRQIPTRPCLTLGAGVLLADPTLDPNRGELANVFVVNGAKPRGSKRKVGATVHLGRPDDNSAWQLRREGARLRLPLVENNGQMKTNARCRRRALHLRDESLRERFAISVEGVLPFPHLDEMDLVRVRTADSAYLFRVTTWTFPLTGEAMSLGAIRTLGGRTVNARRGRLREEP